MSLGCYPQGILWQLIHLSLIKLHFSPSFGQICNCVCVCAPCRHFCSGRVYGLSRVKGRRGRFHPASFHRSVQARWVSAAGCHTTHIHTTSGQTHRPRWSSGLHFWLLCAWFWLSQMHVSFLHSLLVFVCRFMMQQCGGWSMMCVTDNSTSWRFWVVFASRWSLKPSFQRRCRLSLLYRTIHSASRWSSVSEK